MVGNLDKWPLGSTSSRCSGAVRGSPGDLATGLRSPGGRPASTRPARARRRRCCSSGARRATSERLQRPRPRPRGAVRQGQGPLLHQRQLDDRRRSRRRWARRRLLPAAVIDGSAGAPHRRARAAVPRSARSRRTRTWRRPSSTSSRTPTRPMHDRPSNGDLPSAAPSKAQDRPKSSRHRSRPPGGEVEGGHADAVPGLGDADHGRHDFGGDPGAERGQDHAGAVHREPSEGLEQTHSCERPAESRLERGRRWSAAAAPRRAPGEPRRIGYLYILPAFAVYAVFVLAPLVDGASGSRSTQWDGVTPGPGSASTTTARSVDDPAVRDGVHALVRADRLLRGAPDRARPGARRRAVARARSAAMTAFRTHALPAAGDPAVVIGGDLADDVRPEGPMNERSRAVGLGGLAHGLARRLHVGAAGGRRDRDVGDDGPLPGAVHGRRAEDPAEPATTRRGSTAPGRCASSSRSRCPDLRNEIAVALTLTTIAALRNFDIVYITTQGGPGTSTTVPSLLRSTTARS